MEPASICLSSISMTPTFMPIMLWNSGWLSIPSFVALLLLWVCYVDVFVYGEEGGGFRWREFGVLSIAAGMKFP